MSRLVFFAIHEDTLFICPQMHNDPSTGTAAAEDRTGVLCLWADVQRLLGFNPLLVELPEVCRRGECCLTDERYWDKQPNQIERLFS